VKSIDDSATESYMESAKSFAQVLLFWDGVVLMQEMGRDIS
jgi:hypothetical protein